MAIRTNDDALNKLINASDFYDFLRGILSERGAKARVCRLAGFKSRGYLTDLANGKKGISQDGLFRLKVAFKMPRPYFQLFEYMAWQVSPNLCREGVTKAELTDLISKQRKEILVHKRLAKNRSAVGECTRSPQFFQVYAAMGPPSEGATKDEIVLRTGLSSRAVEKHINQLLALKAVEQKGDLFFAPLSQADNLELDDVDSLGEMVRLVCSDIQKNRKSILKEENNLTFYSALSVNKRDVPQLKKKLKSVIFGVLDEFQNDKGNQVQQIFFNLRGVPFSDPTNEG